MPPVKTRSAQSRSLSLNSSVLRLTSLIDQERGNSAATVIKPSGGAGYLAPNTSAVRLKFQNVSASNRGYTNSALHALAFNVLSPGCLPVLNDRSKCWASPDQHDSIKQGEGRPLDRAIRIVKN